MLRRLSSEMMEDPVRKKDYGKIHSEGEKASRILAA
jgi:hypothetical protein